MDIHELKKHIAEREDFSYNVVFKKNEIKFILSFTFIDKDDNILKTDKLDEETRKLIFKVLTMLEECEDLETLYVQLKRLDSDKFITQAIETPNKMITGMKQFKDRDFILIIETLLRGDVE